MANTYVITDLNIYFDSNISCLDDIYVHKHHIYFLALTQITFAVSHKLSLAIALMSTLVELIL